MTRGSGIESAVRYSSVTKSGTVGMVLVCASIALPSSMSSTSWLSAQTSTTKKCRSQAPSARHWSMPRISPYIDSDRSVIWSST